MADAAGAGTASALASSRARTASREAVSIAVRDLAASPTAADAATAATTSAAAGASTPPRRVRPAAVPYVAPPSPAPVTLASTVELQIVVYSGARHLYTRHEQWPLLPGSRATLQDVWTFTQANRVQEDSTGRAGFERMRVDSIDVKANHKAIDWEHCEPRDVANDVLQQFTYLKFTVTDATPRTDDDDDDGGDGDDDGVIVGTADADGEGGGGGDDALLSGGRPVYRGYHSKRGTRAGLNRYHHSLPEADPALPPDTPLACAGKCRYVTLLALCVTALIYFIYFLRLFVAYRPLARECAVFSEFECVHNATATCFEYAGDCYPNDPAYTAAESAGFGLGFLLLSVVLLVGTSAWGAAQSRACFACTWVFGLMACVFALMSASYSFDADGKLLSRGWSVLMYLCAGVLPATLAAWLYRGTFCCPI